ncbi:hypothetical protein Hanom_Chr00s000001g01595241 [Helianthus anomalus]
MEVSGLSFEITKTGKLHFSSFMFVSDCSGLPLTLIITVTMPHEGRLVIY